MLVRPLIGRYAGEVVDMAAHAAHQLIRRGDAVDIRMEAESAPVRGKRGRPRKRTAKTTTGV